MSLLKVLADERGTLTLAGNDARVRVSDAKGAIAKTKCRQATRMTCIEVVGWVCHFCHEIQRINKNYKKSKIGIALSDSKKAQPAAVEDDAVRSVRVSNGEIDSQELFQSQRELLIRHGDDVYRLRRTGLNKLILTK